jgi:hypothetical protein
MCQLDKKEKQWDPPHPPYPRTTGEGRPASASFSLPPGHPSSPAASAHGEGKRRRPGRKDGLEGEKEGGAGRSPLSRRPWIERMVHCFSYLSS